MVWMDGMVWVDGRDEGKFKRRMEGNEDKLEEGGREGRKEGR